MTAGSVLSEREPTVEAAASAAADLGRPSLSLSTAEASEILDRFGYPHDAELTAAQQWFAEAFHAWRKHRRQQPLFDEDVSS